MQNPFDTLKGHSWIILRKQVGSIARQTLFRHGKRVRGPTDKLQGELEKQVAEQVNKPEVKIRLS